jgi:deazaflavin-dependent oxidoreductase (nitroreductase family)
MPQHPAEKIMSKIVIGAPGWTETHLEAYLKTDGAEGHLVDFSAAGGPVETPCLILKTTGRRSGEAKMLPLIYGEDAGHYVIIASKGGAPDHPAWYLNLDAHPEVEFQVIDKKYRGVAQTVRDDAERDLLYAMMAAIYPPYIDYQAKTERRIPVVTLEPRTPIDRL